MDTAALYGPNSGDDKRAKMYRGYLNFLLFTLVALTGLQFAWLVQIFVMGKDELAKFLEA